MNKWVMVVPISCGRRLLLAMVHIMRLLRGNFVSNRSNWPKFGTVAVVVGSFFMPGTPGWQLARAAQVEDETIIGAMTEQQSQARRRLQQALSVACETPTLSMQEAGKRLRVSISTIEPPRARGGTQIKRWMLQYENGAGLRLDFVSRQRSLQQLVLRYGQSVNDGVEIQSPMIEVMADGQCAVQRGREIVYRHNKPAYLVGLDRALDRTAVYDPYNPPVPDSTVDAFDGDADDERSSATVAVVDSGIDYRSLKLLPRLARTDDGSLVGYDYWDDDPFPFDANPSRSPFYPQRHGTRIASIIAEESEVARIAAWRYPRPDPSRFGKLVDDIASRGIRIVNLSMGSTRIEQWRSFEQAVQRHRDMLFVVSAGNNGVDLQRQPIYPAAFKHDNLLTVTSAQDNGELARGSNWGVEAVDIMVPGEQILAMGFADQLRQVSGSSYAAARVSALASCLLAASPDSSALQIKQRIVAMAKSTVANKAMTRHGLIAEALEQPRGACRQPPDSIAEVSRQQWTPPRSEAEPASADAELEYGVALTAVVLKDSGWRMRQVKDIIESAFTILSQCRLTPATVELIELEAPRMTRLMSEQSMQALSEFVARDVVRLFFVEDTLQEIEFGAEAIGRVNARRRPTMRDSVWMTRWVPDAAASLAHELYHVLADSGLHRKEPDNLMAQMTRGDARRTSYVLTTSQCGQLRNIGLGNGLIKPR